MDFDLPRDDLYVYYDRGYTYKGPGMRKLTLSADDKVVEEVRRLALRRKTSISAMFSDFIRNMVKRDEKAGDIPEDSIAARATGFISLPEGKSEGEELADALIEKYGLKK